jgi:hypothetical protein
VSEVPPVSHAHLEGGGFPDNEKGLVTCCLSLASLSPSLSVAWRADASPRILNPAPLAPGPWTLNPEPWTLDLGP